MILVFPLLCRRLEMLALIYNGTWCFYGLKHKYWNMAYVDCCKLLHCIFIIALQYIQCVPVHVFEKKYRHAYKTKNILLEDGEYIN